MNTSARKQLNTNDGLRYNPNESFTTTGTPIAYHYNHHYQQQQTSNVRANNLLNPTKTRSNTHVYCDAKTVGTPTTKAQLKEVDASIIQNTQMRGRQDSISKAPYHQFNATPLLNSENFNQTNINNLGNNIMIPQAYLTAKQYNDLLTVNVSNQGYIQGYYNQYLTPDHHHLKLVQTPIATYTASESAAQVFPDSFDPKNSPNMPHKEKVNRWIKDIPIYEMVSSSGGSSTWRCECYPGIVPGSSASSLDFMYTSSSQSCFNLTNSLELYIDQEDVLEFQARRITQYARKLYHIDTSESTIKGEELMEAKRRFESSFYNDDYSQYLNTIDDNYNFDLIGNFGFYGREQPDEVELNDNNHRHVDLLEDEIIWEEEIGSELKESGRL